jgi:hypothetical protein
MGAFDSLYAPYQCLSCGAHHWGDWQSKFFDPDFFIRYGDSFYLNKPVRVFIDLEELQQTTNWEDTWLALTPWKPGEPFLLVSDMDDWLYCSCGSRLIPCFHFLIEDGGVVSGPSNLKMESALLTLQRAQCVDPSNIDGINFINAERSGDIRGLAKRTLEERRAYFIQEMLAEPFWLPESDSNATVIGPVRCVRCDEIRLRFLWCSFGLTGPHPALKIGTIRTVPFLFDEGRRPLWIQEEDPHQSLTFLFPESWSCACSPDIEMFALIHYVQDGVGLRLERLELTPLTVEAIEQATHIDPSMLLSERYAFNETQRWIEASPAERRAALLQKVASNQ